MEHTLKVNLLKQVVEAGTLSVLRPHPFMTHKYRSSTTLFAVKIFGGFGVFNLVIYLP